MTDSVDVGVWLQPTGHIKELVGLAKFAESSGLGFVGVTDGQMIWREAYTCLAAIATATSNIRIGPWVSNVVTRHPTVLASAICTLDELSDGRAFLGIGNGDDSVLTIGKQRRTLAGLASDVSVMAKLGSGQAIEDTDPPWRLVFDRTVAPPIYWAANGPKSLFQAGQVADGVINSGWITPDQLACALETVAEGARAAGRDPDDVVPIFNSAVSIGDDGERARSIAKPYVARGLMYSTSVQIDGWDEEARQELMNAYSYYDHLSFRQEAVSLVPAELVTTKAIAGTVEEVADQLRMICAAGYKKVALLPLGNEYEVIGRLANEVVPLL